MPLLVVLAGLGNRGRGFSMPSKYVVGWLTHLGIINWLQGGWGQDP